MSKRTDTKPKANRQAKDGVFRALFRIKRYMRQLYLSLFPGDSSVTEDDLTNITLENVLASREYNDIGFLVRDKLMILVEAQSTWSVNTLIRLLIYVLHEYYEYITRNALNLFSTAKIHLPTPYLFIVYTGDVKDVPSEISLKRDFFACDDCSLDLTARVIRDGRQGDIISQYVGFAHVFDEQRKLYGYTDEAIRETIRICVDKNLLAEFMKDHEKEAYDAMQLFTEEFIQNAIRKEAREEGIEIGKQQGMQQGIQQGLLQGMQQGKQLGVLSTLFGLVRKGRLSSADASAEAGLSLAAFNAKMAEYEARPQA